jgi:Phospholipid-translocating P-type ATPase C-terminal
VSIYESWVYTGFNFILGLPIIFYGIQDRDLSAQFVVKYPEVRLGVVTLTLSSPLSVT